MTWKQVKFSDVVESPPKVILKKGEQFSFIPMELVNPAQKYVIAIDNKTFTGGGAKFGEGDTIFARITPCLENGKIAKVKGLKKGVGFGSTEYLVFRAKKDLLDADFLYYLVISPQIREIAIKSMTGSSGRQRAKKEVIDEIKISVPSYEKQVKIGAILSTYDDLIENNHRRMQLLEQAARLIYEEWFIRFRFPGHEQTCFVDGLPEGWTSLPTNQIANINPQIKIDRSQNQVTFISMSCLSTNNMTINTAEFEKRDAFSGVRFQNGDVLFARITPCLENGKTGFVQTLRLGEVACGSTEFVVLRAKLTSSEFLYCLARSENFREAAVKSMTGSSGRQRVQPNFFANYKIPLPPQHLLSKFHDITEPCFKQIGILEYENRKLKEARDLLLPKLMNGEIQI